MKDDIKIGDVVVVSNDNFSWYIRLFLFEYEGAYYCKKGYTEGEGISPKHESFGVSCWLYIKKRDSKAVCEITNKHLTEDFKPGDLVEVSEDGDTWYQRVFMCEHKNYFYAVIVMDEKSFFEPSRGDFVSAVAWKHIRKIRS